MQTPTEPTETTLNTATGPTTPEGKAIVSRNALKFGLFSEKNAVLPGEQPEYDALTEALFARLRPADALEHLYATEIVRAGWRLRRCAVVESRLAEETIGYGESAGCYPTEPMMHPRTWDVQKSVDRARSMAHTVLSKSTAELRRLQNERFASEKAKEKAAPTPITKQTPPAAPTPITKQTQIARSAPCPCQSGQKYKRCCGRNAPPLLNITPDDTSKAA